MNPDSRLLTTRRSLHGVAELVRTFEAGQDAREKRLALPEATTQNRPGR